MCCAFGPAPALMRLTIVADCAAGSQLSEPGIPNAAARSGLAPAGSTIAVKLSINGLRRKDFKLFQGMWIYRPICFVRRHRPERQQLSILPMLIPTPPIRKSIRYVLRKNAHGMRGRRINRSIMHTVKIDPSKAAPAPSGRKSIAPFSFIQRRIHLPIMMRLQPQPGAEIRKFLQPDI